MDSISSSEDDYLESLNNHRKRNATNTQMFRSKTKKKKNITIKSCLPNEINLPNEIRDEHFVMPDDDYAQFNDLSSSDSSSNESFNKDFSMIFLNSLK